MGGQVNGSDPRQPRDLTLAVSKCQLAFRLARSEYLFALGALDLLEVDAAYRIGMVRTVGWLKLPPRACSDHCQRRGTAPNPATCGRSIYRTYARGYRFLI